MDVQNRGIFRLSMLSYTPCNVMGHWFIEFYTDNYFPGLHLLPKSCLAYYLSFELNAPIQLAA
jgi:hypothetical protein